MKLMSMSVSPHLHSANSTRKIMLDVLIALMPAAAVSLAYYGSPVLVKLIVAIISAVTAEGGWQIIRKQKLTVDDLSAAVTGLILALGLPLNTPWWLAAVGAVAAIILAKQLFGGIGRNLFNPALAGLTLVLLITRTNPFAYLTPTTQIVLLVGAAYLFWKKVIDWRIPLAYLGTFSLAIFFLARPVLLTLLSGGIIFSAFFLATDYATSPMRTRGKLIFGAGCGLLTAIIQGAGGSPAGACYAILIMNTLVPWLDRKK